MREFAYALSSLGHSVILLTEVHKGQAADTYPGRKIQKHNFSSPLYLSTEPLGHPLITALRSRSLPWGIRQAIIIYYYVIYKGVFTDWRLGTQSFLPIIAEKFKPDLIWASFGNTDCWNIAKDLAHIAHCPWIADLKDLWSGFIPKTLQKIVSRHFNDYSAITTLSQYYHSRDILKYFNAKSEVIYSGFSSNFFAADSQEKQKDIILSITGGIYNGASLEKIFEGVQLWLLGLSKKKKSQIKIVYAGNDTAIVKSATARLSKIVSVEFRGYLPIDKLRILQKNSTANLYVKTDSYHHKLIEMLSIGRPIICFPAETEEAIAITNSTSVPFYSCKTPKEISLALDQSLKKEIVDVANDAGLKNLTWEAQAIKLENLFQNIVDQNNETASKKPKKI